MSPEPMLEDRLRDALRRPDGSTWPDERGAFDRFRRSRRRRGRVITAQTGLAMVAVVAAALLLPAVVGDHPGGPVRPAVPAAPAVPAGPVVRLPARGFEVPVPVGWKGKKVGFPSPPGPRVEEIVELLPKGDPSPGERRIVLSTTVLVPEQHPGLPPGEDPGGVASELGGFSALDDRDSPLGHGQRPDGRPYVWRTRLLPDEVGEFAIAWPYHCRAGQRCPWGNRFRVLTVMAGRSDDPAVRRELRAVAQRVIDTVRPITNALPGGDPSQLDPALPTQPPQLEAVPVPTTSRPRP